MSAYQSLSDQELTIMLKLGNESAFTEIYVRYWPMLFAHACKMLDEEDEAKDLVQELFIVLWTKASDIDVKTNLRAYLYVSIRHKIINHIRKQRINHDFIHMIALEMDEADEHTVQLLNERDLLAFIDQEISQLPPRMKQVFEMSRKGFMSNKDIAAKLGTSEETVKKQISNSIKILRHKLDKYAGIGIILIQLMNHRP